MPRGVCFGGSSGGLNVWGSGHEYGCIQNDFMCALERVREAVAPAAGSPDPQVSARVSRGGGEEKWARDGGNSGETNARYL